MTPATDHDEEMLDDPDLLASLDEPATEDGDEVFAAIDTMLDAIERAVA